MSIRSDYHHIREQEADNDAKLAREATMRYDDRRLVSRSNVVAIRVASVIFVVVFWVVALKWVMR